MAKEKDLVIEQGKTFKLVVRWENEKIIYKPITDIDLVAPVLITVPGHGIPDGWDVTVVSVKGTTQINAKNNPPRDTDYNPATPITADSIEINKINAADFSAYKSGGYVQFYEPRSLATVTARMDIKDKVGGTILMSLLESNGRIDVDDTSKTITIEILAADTEDIDWVKGVYELEVIENSVVVEALLKGSVTVTKEVTTSL